MIRHVIVLRFREHTTGEQRAALREALATLPAAIPQIRRYRFGDDAGIAADNWDMALVADFGSREDYLVYRSHPAHRDVIERFIKPILADRAVVQFETTD